VLLATTTSDAACDAVHVVPLVAANIFLLVLTTTASVETSAPLAAGVIEKTRLPATLASSTALSRYIATVARRPAKEVLNEG
jgi:hypothetical protein